MSNLIENQGEIVKSGFKKYIGLVLRVLTIVVLLGIATTLIGAHNFTNLLGRATYEEVTLKAENSAQIADLVEKSIRNTQWMNYFEIYICIALPWSLIVLAFFVWRKKLKWEWLFLVFTLALIFLIAQITNIIGVNKLIDREIPYWVQAANSIEHPLAKEYIITDEQNFSAGRDAGISFVTSETVTKDELVEYYRTKGLTENVSGSGNTSFCTEVGYIRLDTSDPFAKVSINLNVSVLDNGEGEGCE